MTHISSGQKLKQRVIMEERTLFHNLIDKHGKEGTKSNHFCLFHISSCRVVTKKKGPAKLLTIMYQK